MSAKRVIQYAVLPGLMLLAVAAVFRWAPAVGPGVQIVLEKVRESGPLGVGIFVAVYLIACVTCAPCTVLGLGAGALYGLANGLALVSFSSTLGAICAFSLGRFLARGWVERRIGADPRFAAIDDAVQAEGWKIVALTRLSPVFPFGLSNYLYGLTNISLKHYALASWVAMLPGTTLIVYLGSLANDLARVGEAGASAAPTAARWVVNGLAVLATALVAVLAARIAKRALAAKTGAE